MNYKVVIPCAGLGTRLGAYTKYMNKALVTLGKKPAICRIIEKFDVNTEIVILLGYAGPHLKEVVQAFYPSRNIRFVHVDNFDGPGSGLGYSLMCAKSILQCPFIFISNDTIIPNNNIELNPNTHGNWIGFYKKTNHDQYEVSNYRTISSSDGILTKINPKGIEAEDIYIGLAGILEYELFWALMTSRDEALEIGESLGVQSLRSVHTKEFSDWLDCGNLKSLELGKILYDEKDINILDKEDEAIWFHGQQVIKFSVNEEFISQRTERLKFLPKKSFPELRANGKYHYTYNRLPGLCLADNTNNKNFIKLLNYCEGNMWSIKAPDSYDKTKIIEEFYHQKTFERLQHFNTRYEKVECEKKINGVNTLIVEEMLQKLDWQKVASSSRFARFHGDLHGENILINDDDLYFIDWRQNFGKNNYEFGDVYYDLAKLLHGLIVNHGIVRRELFFISEEKDGSVVFEINRLHSLVKAEEILKNWCISAGYDWSLVELVCALIFINICGLHEWPYAQLLYYLGRYMLANVLEAGSDWILQDA
jgi:choline kinase